MLPLVISYWSTDDFVGYFEKQNYLLMKSYLISFIIRAFVCTSWLTDWGRDKMAAIFQTTYLNVFSWMKCLNLPLVISYWSTDDFVGYFEKQNYLLMKSYLISFIIRAFVCTSWLTDWGRDKMAAIFQTTYLNVFSWMKCLNFDEDFTDVLQLTILQHWFRWWFGARLVTKHYLNQWWLVYLRIYASLGLSELTLVVIYKYRDNYVCEPYTYGATTWEVDSLVPGSCVCKWVNFEFTIPPKQIQTLLDLILYNIKPMQRLPATSTSKGWLDQNLVKGKDYQWHPHTAMGCNYPSILGRDYHWVVCTD